MGSVNLSVQLKIGKIPVTANVDAETPDAAVFTLKQVISLLGEDADIQLEPAQKAATPKAPGKRESKKNAEIQTRQMNELALVWVKRAITAIPHFNGMTEQQVAETLKFRTAMALMTAEESSKLVQILQDTLTTYAHNNADVAAYLKILRVIEGLETPEEWDAKKLTELGSGDWANLQINGAHLLNAAKAELEARQNLLSIAQQVSAA